MIAIPNPTYGLVVFDGSVLEIFDNNGKSTRYHVRLLQSVELIEKKNYIELKYTELNMSQHVPFKTEAMEQARELVSAVQAAISGN